MLQWLISNAATIVISAALLAVVILIVRGIVTKKITACGSECSNGCGGCAGCAMAGRCHAAAGRKGTGA